MGRKWCAVTVLAITYIVATTAVAANDKGLSFAGTAAPAPEEASSLRKPVSLDGTAHHHVWPPLNAGWRTVLGSFIGFFGAALGSIGGVGGGGIFVPMLTLIVGFDTKSATAMSKCMITGAAVSTVYCNLKLKHPTLNMPMIDYDLALLIQPMLMMGIPVSAGVSVYQAVGLVQGKRVISSRANTKASLKSHIVLIYFFGVSAGVLAGLLGLGGGVIMGPLFLELGIPPQVSSATATFAMMFSSSIAVVEYYLLNWFPIPYACGKESDKLVRRASLIIFILSFMIFIGLIPLGGFGILNINHKMAQHEYMGFHSICKSDT
ncbi:hypothetical protein ZWY2020_026193 [Hordeum vulgare]|nr:hypothetical protein ZWY2020_026193 [Hordeum vulgare]